MKLHFGNFKLSLSSKIDFWPFLKLQEIEYRENEFFWPGLFKNFGPMWSTTNNLLPNHFCIVLVVDNIHFFRENVCLLIKKNPAVSK